MDRLTGRVKFSLPNRILIATLPATCVLGPPFPTCCPGASVSAQAAWRILPPAGPTPWPCLCSPCLGTRAPAASGPGRQHLRGGRRHTGPTRAHCPSVGASLVRDSFQVTLTRPQPSGRPCPSFPPALLVDEEMGRPWEGASWPHLPQCGQLSPCPSLPLTPGPCCPHAGAQCSWRLPFWSQGVVALFLGARKSPQSWTPKLPGQWFQDLILCSVG